MKAAQSFAGAAPLLVGSPLAETLSKTTLVPPLAGDALCLLSAIKQAGSSGAEQSTARAELTAHHLPALSAPGLMPFARRRASSAWRSLLAAAFDLRASACASVAAVAPGASSPRCAKKPYKK